MGRLDQLAPLARPAEPRQDVVQIEVETTGHPVMLLVTVGWRQRGLP